MDLEGFYANWIKSDRERNTTWSHLNVESKKQNKQNKNELKDTENKWMVIEGEGDRFVSGDYEVQTFSI